jgi:hypothetical protein
LLEGFHASPARPYDSNIKDELKMVEVVASFKRRRILILVNAKAHNL